MCRLTDRRGRPGRATEEDERDELWASADLPPAVEVSDDSLVNAKQSLADAVDGLVGVLSSAELRDSIGATDRANLAKYLTIAKLRLENAIALVRSDDAGYWTERRRLGQPRAARPPATPRPAPRPRPPRAPTPARAGAVGVPARPPRRRPMTTRRPRAPQHGQRRRAPGAISVTATASARPRRGGRR